MRAHQGESIPNGIVSIFFLARGELCLIIRLKKKRPGLRSINQSLVDALTVLKAGHVDINIQLLPDGAQNTSNLLRVSCPYSFVSVRLKFLGGTLNGLTLSITVSSNLSQCSTCEGGSWCRESLSQCVYLLCLIRRHGNGDYIWLLRL